MVNSVQLAKFTCTSCRLHNHTELNELRVPLCDGICEMGYDANSYFSSFSYPSSVPTKGGLKCHTTSKAMLGSNSKVSHDFQRIESSVEHGTKYCTTESFRVFHGDMNTTTLYFSQCGIKLITFKHL